MNSSNAIKMLPRNFFHCIQKNSVPLCWMLKPVISRKCVGTYSTRLVSSIVPQVLQERTKLNNVCTNEEVVGRSCNLHHFIACNCMNTCHQRRNFCVLKPSRPVISSGYFSENRDGIIERLQNLYEKNSIRKSWTLTGKVKVNDSSKSAVMLPFCLVRGEPSILLTLRSTKLNSHRGQVSFPGGRMDKEDPNEIHTALREMEEELGISSSCTDVLGELPPILDRTQRLVHPVVGFIGDIESLNMQMNPDEVEAVFTMTLAHLCDSKNRRFTLFMRPKFSFTSPVFLGGEHRVWGLSAILLNTVLGAVLPDDYIPLERSEVVHISK